MNVAADDSKLPPAQELLDGCIGTLPDIPLVISGQLQSKSKDGDIEARINVEMLLDWQADPPTARYTLRDNFGHALEHLSVTWPAHNASRSVAGELPEYRYFQGDPLVAAPVPVLSEPVRGTDISWMDLSLSFLWWPDGRTVGAEDVRSRTCYVLEVPAPREAEQAPSGSFGGCSKVRLWIDLNIHIMLRADAYDAAGQFVRRMDVKGFKKINERWVIQHVEIESYPSRHRTVLRVRDVQDRTRKSYLREDAGPDGEEVEGVEPVAAPL
ncbi:MAG: outer membrane lipoprotein-sorting protein [bacterium]